MKGFKVNLLWRCARGHRWQARFDTIKKGSWCPACGLRRLTMGDLRRLAAQRGGKCLSTTYVNSRTPLQWQCLKRHVWWTNAENIRYHWCPACARNRKLELKELRRIARQRGGRLLSCHYVNAHTHLWWRCANWHLWKARAASVVPRRYGSGTWCVKCFRISRRGRPVPIVTLEDMQQIAAERGGKCVSDVYVNGRTRLKWRCARGHEWMARPQDVKQGRWCPRCGSRVPEFAQLLEAATRRGGSLISSESKYRNSSSVLLWACAEGHRWKAAAFGIRHGSWCPRCAGRTRLSLEEMHRLARARGGECLSKRYVNALTPLKWRCARGHVWKTAPKQIKPYGHRKQGTWCPVCANGPKKYTIEDMRAIARARGGECLSKKHVSTASRLVWRCERGHTWKAAPRDVMAGNKPGKWCRKCAWESYRLTIEEMQAMARARGGECLSKKYLNCMTPLRWRCAKGHTWRQTPNKVKSHGSWCPICARKRATKRQGAAQTKQPSATRRSRMSSSPTSKGKTRQQDSEIRRVS